MIDKGASPERRLVVIGGGISGMNLLLTLAESRAKGLRITVIEPSPVLGLGLAHSTRRPEHLLNVPAERMSLNADAPDEFVEWIRKEKGDGAKSPDWPFVSRLWFGEYARSRIERLPKDLFTHRGSRATALRRNGDQWVIETDDGQEIPADLVAVATGYQARLATGVLKMESEAVRGRVLQPYDSAALAAIPRDEEILIVGTGLTAIDVFRSLRTLGCERIRFLSRHGRFPEGLDPTLPVPLLPGLSERLRLAPLPLLQHLREVQKRSAGLRWDALIAAVTPHASEIWNRWSSKDRRRFLGHLRHYWEITRHRVPATVRAELTSDILKLRIPVLAGKISGTRMKDSTTVEVSMGSSAAFDTKWIVLAVGARVDQSLAAQPAGVGLQACPFGLGYLEASAPDVWILGPSSLGKYWEVTSVPEIVRRSKEIAEAILARSKS